MKINNYLTLTGSHIPLAGNICVCLHRLEGGRKGRRKEERKEREGEGERENGGKEAKKEP